jgi:hypothetical protein
MKYLQFEIKPETVPWRQDSSISVQLGDVVAKKAAWSIVLNAAVDHAPSR